MNAGGGVGVTDVGDRLEDTDHRELRAFATDAASELDILRHDRHTLRVDGGEVGVFQKADEVCFSCLLESEDCSRLEAKIGTEVLRNFTHETLERELANEEL